MAPTSHCTVWHSKISCAWIYQHLKTYRICNQAQIEISTVLHFGLWRKHQWPFTKGVADTRQLLSDWLEPKNARGDSGLNEQFHSDQNPRRHSHGDSHEKAGGHHRLYDMLGFNATGPTRGHSHEKARENARGHFREWGRCFTAPYKLSYHYYHYYTVSGKKRGHSILGITLTNLCFNYLKLLDRILLYLFRRRYVITLFLVTSRLRHHCRVLWQYFE